MQALQKRHKKGTMSLHFVETYEEESALVIARFIGDVLDGEKVSRRLLAFPNSAYCKANHSCAMIQTEHKEQNTFNRISLLLP